MMRAYDRDLLRRDRKHHRRRWREIRREVKDESGRADGHWIRNWLSRIGDPRTKAHRTIREAQARGLQLLVENLSASQRDQYENHGYFDVIGGETGTRYRIRKGHQMNVELLDSNGTPVFALCFMPRGRLADGDVMLAQKMALELFEFEAVKVANKIANYAS
jgi:hypothetical protein